MLTNKKSFVRILALVMALLMTVAIFAGCKDKSADEIDAIKQQLAEQEAANKKAQEEAANASKEQEEALKNIEDLLNDLKEQEDKANSEIKESVDKVNDRVDGYHNVTTAPVVTEEPIIKEEHESITQKVLTEEKLAAYSELITLYTKDRADWYTAANFAKLAKIFEEASFELYRATTADGVDQVIAEASAAAAAIDSIVSDAAKVQALIDAFGNVETEIFTTNDDKVEAARAAFDNWVKTYEIRFFVKNGCTAIKYNAKNELVIAGNEKALVDFARKITNNLVYININDNTNSLLYAEAKVAALYDYAEEAIKNEMIAQLIISGDLTQAKAAAVVEVLFDEDATQVELNAALDQYKSVLAIVDRWGVTYADCKANGKLIEDAYFAYRVFWNANGGDDTPISGAPAAALLTGEQFVKLYVLTLYNGELSEYQNTVKDYLYDKVIEYFMNVKNSSDIKVATGWKNFLQFSQDYTLGYNEQGAAVVAKVSNAATFAVEKDAIVLYDEAGAPIYSIPADGVKIEKDFNRVAAKAATAIFALDYDKDFKGNKSLDDAYVAIDQIIVEAICELAQVYYDDVVVPVLLDEINMYDDFLKEYYTDADKRVARNNDTYRAHDAAFYANLTKLFADMRAAVKAFKVNTYEELNQIAWISEDGKIEIFNLKDQQMFEVKKDDQGTFDSISLYTGDKNGNNSALKTILAKFAKAMENNAVVYHTKWNNLQSAIAFHELKVDYAEAIDAIAGDGATFKSDDTLEKGKIGLLGADYYYTIQEYMGKTSGKYNLKQAAIYAAVDAPRKAAVNAIFALEYMNYETAEPIYTIESYQAKNVGKKAEALYYDKDGKVTKTADKNTALTVIVDRDVVAQNAIINTFATGADAIVKAFADLARAKVQANVSEGKALYEANYSFGKDDPAGVYLEKDMDAYIEYLNSLTGLAGITAFKAVDFSLVDDRIALDLFVQTLAGYTYQEVKNTKGEIVARMPHITAVDKTVDEITGTGATTEGGYYRDLATKQLDAFFTLDAKGACKGLESVRELAYLKDTVLRVELPALKIELLGEWDATTKDWKVIYEGIFAVDKLTPALPYEMGTLRTQVYLNQFNACYDRIVAAVEAVNYVDFAKELGFNDQDEALADAYAAVLAILAQAENSTVVYDEPDDMSLIIAYYRYYAINQYDWAEYNKNIND